jgi:hypothetical protein
MFPSDRRGTVEKQFRDKSLLGGKDLVGMPRVEEEVCTPQKKWKWRLYLPARECERQKGCVMNLA